MKHRTVWLFALAPPLSACTRSSGPTLTTPSSTLWDQAVSDIAL